jgi:hypothetical protein
MTTPAQRLMLMLAALAMASSEARRQNMARRKVANRAG